MTLKLSDLVKSSEIYREAFTHKSLSSDKNFERLEFLGDSLLGSQITETLYKTYPESEEGDLSRWRSALVSQETLAEVCDELNLVDYFMAKESEAKKLKKNERIKASIFESFLGAYYLDKGNEALTSLVSSLFLDKVKRAKDIFSMQDPKTLFQEEAQKLYKKTPTYKTIEQTGPSHAPKFKVAAILGDEAFEKGEGKSVKEAQMEAARAGLNKIKNTNMEKN